MCPTRRRSRIAELPRDEYCRGVARRQCRLASCTIEVHTLAGVGSALCAADAVGRCEQLPEAEDSVALPSRLDEHGRASATSRETSVRASMAARKTIPVTSITTSVSASVEPRSVCFTRRIPPAVCVRSVCGCRRCGLRSL